jgi:hypothetical protein
MLRFKNEKTHEYIYVCEYKGYALSESIEELASKGVSIVELLVNIEKNISYAKIYFFNKIDCLNRTYNS